MTIPQKIHGCVGRRFAALRIAYEIECADDTCGVATLYLSMAGMRMNRIFRYTGKTFMKLMWLA
jgi:hypothetical protein